MTRGDPESPLRWTAKSTRTLSEDLEKRGLRASPQKVGELLHELGYSLQSTRKTIEGNQHPDRNAQIEHCLFCHITENWRGRPLVDLETIVQLIGSTRTKKGLRVKAGLDPRQYATGVVVQDEEIEGLRVRPDAFHGEWNYTLRPRRAA